MIASYGQLNREWMQQSVADAYSWIVRSAFRMMADERYHPEEFVLNVAEEGAEPVYEAIMSDVFRTDFKVSVEAGSMAPLVEQLERDDALQLFNNLIQLPEIDRYEAIYTLLKAHRVKDPDKLFKDSMDADATKAAQLENVAYLQTGGDPGVVEGEDHQVHIEIHGQLLNQLMQQMGQLQQMPAVAPMPGLQWLRSYSSSSSSSWLSTLLRPIYRCISSGWPRRLRLWVERHRSHRDHRAAAALVYREWFRVMPSGSVSR